MRDQNKRKAREKVLDAEKEEVKRKCENSLVFFQYCVKS